MLTTCPWGYPPHSRVCQGCKRREECALYRSPQEAIVINGLFGVWREDGTLIVENTSSKLVLSAAHLDSLIAALEVAQQELRRPWEPASPKSAT